MKLRNMRERDLGQVYDLFSSAQVRAREVREGRVPKTGFYEYHLSEEDIRRRIKNPEFSIVAEDWKGIAAYMIAYSLSRISEDGLLESHADPVLSRLSGIDSSVVYADQLFVRPGVFAYHAGRVSNLFDFLVARNNVPGVVTAIPQRPWKNVSSTRFILHRGFCREGFVEGEGMQLGLFTKPVLSGDFSLN